MSSNAVQSTSGSLFIEGYPDENPVVAFIERREKETQ
jgi:hypothetical protein